MKVTIDGTEYDTDNMTEEAKSALANVQFVQNEMKVLEGRIAVFKTANSLYTQALKQELEKND